MRLGGGPGPSLVPTPASCFAHNFKLSDPSSPIDVPTEAMTPWVLLCSSIRCPAVQQALEGRIQPRDVHGHVFRLVGPVVGGRALVDDVRVIES